MGRAHSGGSPRAKQHRFLLCKLEIAWDSMILPPIIHQTIGGSFAELLSFFFKSVYFWLFSATWLSAGH